MKKQNILIIGAGVAGMEASQLLTEAGHKVYLVEKESLIGGQTIKFEEVYPNMECSTCMVSPKQQEILQNENIELLLLSEVKEVNGTAGEFKVKVKKKARYVSLANCIGCGACYEPCPVSLDNYFEEGLSKMKAIAVPCAGALPNVPAIDAENCLHLNGKKKECQACKEACMFDAIDFSEKDEMLDLEVSAIIVATGFDMLDLKKLSQYGYNQKDNVYTAMEFERLYAENGPTEGKLILRDGETPKTIGIIHCAGREEQGYCSAVCCMYSTKFSHFLKHKLPEAKIKEFHSDLCIPGKSHQKFYQEALQKEIEFIRCRDIEDLSVEKKNGSLQVNYQNGNIEKNSFKANMIIVAPAMLPGKDTKTLAETLGLSQDDKGFFATKSKELSPVATAVEGIFVAGCAEGPKDIPDSITQAEAAVGKIMNLIQGKNNE